MIRAADLAACAVSKVRTPAIPYVLGGRSDAGTDCINLVGWCVQELGGKKADVPRGSNTAWRTAMQWRGTLADAQAQDRLVPGAVLYICDGPTSAWPDGDYGHAGIYVGLPDMEVVHASSSRGGVYPSTLKNGWTHVAWLAAADYGAGASAPAPETESGITQAKSATVLADGGLRLRKTPGGEYMMMVPQGAVVPVMAMATSGGILHIQTVASNANGTFTGWLATTDASGKAYLQMEAQKPEAEAPPEIGTWDAYQLGYDDGYHAGIEAVMAAAEALMG